MASIHFYSRAQNGLEGMEEELQWVAPGTRERPLKEQLPKIKKITDLVRGDQKDQEIDQAESADTLDETKEVDKTM